MGTEKRERQKAGRQARLDQARVEQAKRQRFRMVRNLAIVGVVVIALLFVLSRNSDDDGDEVDTAASSSTTAGDGATSTSAGASSTETTPTTEFVPTPFEFGTGPCAAADGSSERTIDFEAPPAECIDPARTYTATFETSHGTVTVELDTEATPGATNNFVNLARFHYYDDTALFRTDQSIGIIQGGSPHTQDNGDPGPGYTIADEGFGDEAALSSSGGPYRYEAGDLVYARPGGSPDSSSAQFFFCVNDACSNLDSQGIYIEFGRVTEGLDVLEAILALDAGGAPSEEVTVESVTITEA